MQFRIRRDSDFGESLEVRIVADGRQGDYVSDGQGNGVETPAYVSKCEMTFTSVKKGEFVSVPPALILHQEEAQQLCDALWEAGIKPSSGHGSTGQLAATEKHLGHVSALLSDVVSRVKFKGEK